MPSDPLEQLLSSNDAPTPGEVGVVNDLCKDSAAEVAALQILIDKYTTRRDELLGFLKPRQNILSPLRHLPTEVLQNIFMQCLEPFPVFDTSEAPILLTHICRRWREIAMETPELWSSFHVVYPCNPSKRDIANLSDFLTESRRLKQAVRTWLQRSRPAKLTISLKEVTLHDNFHHLPVRAVADELRQLMGLLEAHCQRWYHLEVALPMLRSFGSSLTTLDTPALQIFSSVSDRAPLTARPPESVAFLRGASRLQRFHLHDDRQQLFGPPVLQYTLLEEMEIRLDRAHIDLAALMFMLVKCRNLRKLVLRFDGLKILHSIYPTTVILPRLESVELRMEPLEPILAHLTLPRLHSMALWENLTDRMLHELHSLLDRSSCPITHLTLRLSDNFMAWTQLQDCFKQIPQLEVLDVKNRGPLQKIFQLLRLDEETRPILPSLHTLKFVAPQWVDGIESTVLDFLTSSGRKLSSVVVDYDGMNTVFVSAIQALGKHVVVENHFVPRLPGVHHDRPLTIWYPSG